MTIPWANKTCARCGDRLVVSSMSYFNEDICCMDCLDDEKLAPGYGIARERELQAVKAGVRNFAGVGLSAEDREFLTRRRALRRSNA